VSTDSKPKKTWWEWSELNWKVHYGLGYVLFRGLLLLLRQAWAGMMHLLMSRSLSKLASVKSKNVILDMIADLSCAWTSIIGQDTSAKTKFPSWNLFSLLFPQTQKNEIEVSIKYGIALLFQSVPWVVGMLCSSVITSVPTFANVTMSTWRTVHTCFGNITIHLAAYNYVAHFHLSM